MDAIGYVSAVATPEIMEAKRDTAIATRSDLSLIHIFFQTAVEHKPHQAFRTRHDKRRYAERQHGEHDTLFRDPVFDKLDATLAHAMMSIPATKAFAVGAGVEAAGMTCLLYTS